MLPTRLATVIAARRSAAVSAAVARSSYRAVHPSSSSRSLSVLPTRFHSTATPSTPSMTTATAATDATAAGPAAGSAPAPVGSAKNLVTPATQRAYSSVAPNQSSGSESFPPLAPGYTIRKGSNSSFAVFQNEVEKPILDDRSYRLVTLANGLECLLVHDPTTDKASAAMDIKVGHLSDPDSLPGLAHFCEHMLFLGTAKYPRENEYSEFLSTHNGGSNAYTGMENTNYYFSVGHAHLEGALDRFAQFFIAPLFDASCTEREIRAVDSENKKNLQSDLWRSFQMEKSLANEHHPYSKFGTGSKATLWDAPNERGENVRDELLKFHERYYSANVMKLVVLGRESLDQLTDLVVNKFSSVPNKNIEPPKFSPDTLLPSQLQTQVLFRTVKDVRMLQIVFPIPDQNPHFKTKPAQFLSHLIGHEGPGSILSALKAHGWSNHLSAGATDGANGFEFFKISVDLTTTGLKQYESVLKVIFDYISLLRAEGSLQDWAYEEVKQLSQLDFTFKEKAPASSYTSELSSQMQFGYPREWVLSGPYLTREFDKSLIRQLLERFTPQTCRVYIAAQQMPDGSDKYQSKEQWYGTEYTLEKLPDPSERPAAPATESAAALRGESVTLALPRPNSFIPSNFDVPGTALKGKVSPTKRPVLLESSPTVRLWHKQDDRFFQPKANFYMLFQSPLIDATPANAVKSRMLVELLRDALTEYSYDAELAGLGYSLDSQSDGLELWVNGYNDKLADFVLHILKTMKEFVVDPTRFELIKDQVVRMYENFSLEAPYQHANYYTTYMLMERMWTPKDKLAEVQALTPEEVQTFLQDVLRRLQMEMLVHGNIAADTAKKLAQDAESIIGARALAEAEKTSYRSLLLPWGKKYVYSQPAGAPEEPNSSVEYYLQVGDPTDVAMRVQLALLSQIADEPVFDILRTKEQLGYLVFSSPRAMIGSAGWRVIVQSEQSPEYVESRIDAFLRGFAQTLDKLSPEEFERHRTSLLHARTETVKYLTEESNRFWYHIHSHYYDFLKRDADVEALKEVTHQQIKDLFARYIHPDSSQRAQLLVQIHSQQPAATPPEPVTTLSPAARSVAQDQLRALVPDHELLQQLDQPESIVTLNAVIEVLAAQAVAKPTHLPEVSATSPTRENPETEVPTEVASPAHPVESVPSQKVEQVQAAIAAVRTAAQDHPLTPVATPPLPILQQETIKDPIAFKASLRPSQAAVALHDWEYYSSEPEREPEPQPQSQAVVQDQPTE